MRQTHFRNMGAIYTKGTGGGQWDFLSWERGGGPGLAHVDPQPGTGRLPWWEQRGPSRAGRLSRDVGNGRPLSGGSSPVILHPRPSWGPPVSFKGCVALAATVVFTSTYFAAVEARRVHLRALLRWSNVNFY